jgi:hypothetical protein
MRRLLAVVAGLAALLVLAAPAGAILGGVPDGDAHPHVGLVAFYDAEGTYLHRCSGTLISPTVVLTAGHCTVGTALAKVWFAPELDVHPRTDPPGGVAGTPHTHPQYCEGCAPGLPGFITHDVGVVVLSTPVASPVYGELPAPDQLRTVDQGTGLTAVGYGVQDFARGGGPPQAVAELVRYRATVALLSTKSRVGEMFIKHSGGQAKGGTCFGDSGGPVFLPDQTTVLAVTSFGTNGVCAGVGYAQRIDRPDVLRWIGGFLT